MLLQQAQIGLPTELRLLHWCPILHEGHTRRNNFWINDGETARRIAFWQCFPGKHHGECYASTKRNVYVKGNGFLCKPCS